MPLSRTDRAVDLHRRLQDAGWVEANGEENPADASEWTSTGKRRLALMREVLKAKGLLDRKVARKWMEERLAAGFFPPGDDPVSEFWLACLVDLEIYERAEALALVELAVTSALAGNLRG